MQGFFLKKSLFREFYLAFFSRLHLLGCFEEFCNWIFTQKNFSHKFIKNCQLKNDQSFLKQLFLICFAKVFFGYIVDTWVNISFLSKLCLFWTKICYWIRKILVYGHEIFNCCFHHLSMISLFSENFLWFEFDSE